MSDRPYLPAAGSDWLLPLYDPLTKLLGVESLHRRLIELAALQPGDRVLEIGCGTGNLTVLAKRMRPGATLVGLDPDPKALARAARKAERAHASVQFDRGFAQELLYPDASFERVLSSLMLHHLPAEVKPRALAEVQRVLAPGGSVYIADFAGEGAGLHARIAALLGHRHGSQPDDTVIALLREAGFEAVEVLGHQTRVFGAVTYYAAAAPAH